MVNLTKSTRKALDPDARAHWNNTPDTMIGHALVAIRYGEVRRIVKGGR